MERLTVGELDEVWSQLYKLINERESSVAARVKLECARLLVNSCKLLLVSENNGKKKIYQETTA